MTKQQQNEIKKQIENECGFKKEFITLLECGGKSYLSNKYEYVMFEVKGVQYQYRWHFADDTAELLHYDEETGHTTVLF